MDRDDDIARFFGSSATPAAASKNDFSLDPADEPEAGEREEVAAQVAAEEEQDGEIAVDVYQTDSDVVIVSPIAGVTAAEIQFTDDSVTITGERTAKHTENSDSLLIQEIFWGSFSRTVQLPVACDVDNATHTFKDGVLTVKVPKVAKAKKRVVKVKGPSK
jgi:HSP20 family molecular chaperone IbpA